MANNYFRFKQFVIQQDRCAMKVGTDGTLLGAWVSAGDCRNILDVGTGAGLIALMLAQRNPEAAIDAVDIDTDACSQAKENVAGSPFAGRIHVVHASFADYASTTTSTYDLIVSNPPYFVRSLKNPDMQRRIARHADTLPLEELMEKGRRLLSPDGRMAFILPADREQELRALACGKGLHIVRQTDVVPVSGGAAKRLLVELSASPTASIEKDTLSIEKAHGEYSQAYIALTKDFYLKMEE
ncbi:MAG: methyltransferase [Tannerellaceae bacterium]|jgi:tRNA1Val (adenine37-N6)-methyltransferase|nr:methyltransferase [Tannerellaceae bacterium]